MKHNEYKCEACGEIYTNKWSDEEAIEEANDIWPQWTLKAGMIIICDDCFQKGYKKLAHK